MNNHKAVFLDRDGTINIDKNYLYKIEDFEFLPGAIEGLKILANLGYKLIIITNQSGIARGYYSEDDYKKLESWMNNRLFREGVEITASYHCPHHTLGIVPQYRCECNCRKPKLGLFEKAVYEHGIKIDESIAIGDKERDIEIARKYNIKGYLIYSDCNSTCANIQKLKGGLLQAAEYIRDAYKNK